jgi:hypothetical protein
VHFSITIQVLGYTGSTKLICDLDVVPLQAWGGPEGSRKLRFPDFLTTAQDGGKFVSFMHRPHLPQGHSANNVNEKFHGAIWDFFTCLLFDTLTYYNQNTMYLPVLFVP